MEVEQASAIDAANPVADAPTPVATPAPTEEPTISRTNTGTSA